MDHADFFALHYGYRIKDARLQARARPLNSLLQGEKLSPTERRVRKWLYVINIMEYAPYAWRARCRAISDV